MHFCPLPLCLHFPCTGYAKLHTKKQSKHLSIRGNVYKSMVFCHPLCLLAPSKRGYFLLDILYMTNDIKIINFTFQIILPRVLRCDIYGNKLNQPAISVVWAEKDKPTFCQYFIYYTTWKDRNMKCCFY